MSIGIPSESSGIKKYFPIVEPLLRGLLGCDLNICVIGDVGQDRVDFSVSIMAMPMKGLIHVGVR